MCKLYNAVVEPFLCGCCLDVYNEMVVCPYINLLNYYFVKNALRTRYAHHMRNRWKIPIERELLICSYVLLDNSIVDVNFSQINYDMVCL